MSGDDPITSTLEAVDAGVDGETGSPIRPAPTEDIAPGMLGLGLAAIWLLAATILLWVSWNRIGTLTMWDPDDYMRLQQVRDLLGGQNYFDVTQYRVDPPAGVAMHWSRIVDLPIAGLILLLQPLLGASLAERVAVSAVPLITFAGSLTSIALIAARLAGRRVALAAAILTAMTPMLLFHILPMRIDHHGWQTMLGLAAAAACFDPRPTRGGVIAGMAMAMWLAISLEALPMAAAVAALLAVRFAGATDDSGPARRFRSFAATLAVGGVLTFAGTHGIAAWSRPWCDTFGPAWFGPLVAAPLAAALLVPRAAAHGPAARIALLALVGTGGVALFALTAPACLAGPFGTLDPVVTRYWYQNVAEGMPIWRQAAGNQIMLALFPPIGLAGMLLAWRAAPTAAAARNWLALFALGGAAFALALFVQRAGGFAHALALPGAAWLLVQALSAIRWWRWPALRALASAAAILALSPAGGLIAGQALLDRPAPRQALSSDAPGCARCDRFAAIARLPRATILASIDITPSLLLSTPHSFAGSAHHRGAAGIRRILDAFLGEPEVARRIMRERDIDYILIDPNGAEARIYRKAAPAGLMARLLNGRPPAWLAPVPLGTSPLRMWRRVD